MKFSGTLRLGGFALGWLAAATGSHAQTASRLETSSSSAGAYIQSIATGANLPEEEGEFAYRTLLKHYLIAQSEACDRFLPQGSPTLAFYDPVWGERTTNFVDGLNRTTSSMTTSVIVDYTPGEKIRIPARFMEMIHGIATFRTFKDGGTGLDSSEFSRRSALTLDKLTKALLDPGSILGDALDQRQLREEMKAELPRLFSRYGCQSRELAALGDRLHAIGVEVIPYDVKIRGQYLYSAREAPRAVDGVARQQFIGLGGKSFDRTYIAERFNKTDSPRTFCRPYLFHDINGVVYFVGTARIVDEMNGRGDIPEKDITIFEIPMETLQKRIAADDKKMADDLAQRSAFQMGPRTNEDTGLDIRVVRLSMDCSISMRSLYGAASTAPLLGEGSLASEIRGSQTADRIVGLGGKVFDRDDILRRYEKENSGSWGPHGGPTYFKDAAGKIYVAGFRGRPRPAAGHEEKMTMFHVFEVPVDAVEARAALLRGQGMAEISLKATLGKEFLGIDLITGYGIGPTEHLDILREAEILSQ